MTKSPTIHPNIIVTRPIGQARHLIEVLQRQIAGLNTPVQIINLPLLTIVPKEDESTFKGLTKILPAVDLVVFVSPNAVECTMRLLGDFHQTWNGLAKRSLQIGVMGGSSKEALLRHGIADQNIILPPDSGRWDSEGLWGQLQNFHSDWHGKSVLFLKGEGGREWLADTMSSAGVAVSAISVYARMPLNDLSPAWRQLDQAPDTDSIWVLTSSEAVRYLAASIAQGVWRNVSNLRNSSALCSHPNIARAAHEAGFGEVMQCSPGDEAIAQALLTWLPK